MYVNCWLGPLPAGRGDAAGGGCGRASLAHSKVRAAGGDGGDGGTRPVQRRATVAGGGGGDEERKAGGLVANAGLGGSFANHIIQKNISQLHLVVIIHT